jgi:hypothetical protein
MNSKPYLPTVLYLFLACTSLCAQDRSFIKELRYPVEEMDYAAWVKLSVALQDAGEPLGQQGLLPEKHDLSNGKGTIELISVKRTAGDMLLVIFRYHYTGSSSEWIGDLAHVPTTDNPARYLYLVDTKSRKLYRPVTDSDDRSLSADINCIIAQGQTKTIWCCLPSPLRTLFEWLFVFREHCRL